MELTPEQLEAAETLLREKLEEEALEKAKSALAEDSSEEIERLVTERLSKMKGNVDKAYEKLDAETREKTRLAEEIKSLKRAQMEAEGKHLELAQMKTAELSERNKILEDRVTELTRDQKVKDVLVGKDFLNDFARQTAFNAIVSSLVEDEERGWIHRSGVSVEEYFDVFAKDPNHEILFKSKENSGTGVKPSGKSKEGTRPKKLSELTSAELIEMADTGVFGGFDL